MKSTLLVFLYLMLLTQSDYRTKSDTFLGDWKAQWSISSNDKLVKDTSASFVMNGVFSFHNNGSVVIKGFGYPGCIFSEDTIMYQTRWFLNLDQLVIGNDKTNQFSYQIETADSDHIKLLLLGDIHLILDKR